MSVFLMHSYIELAEGIAATIGRWVRGGDTAADVVSQFGEVMDKSPQRLRSPAPSDGGALDVGDKDEVEASISDDGDERFDGSTFDERDVLPLYINEDGTLQVRTFTYSYEDCPFTCCTILSLYYKSY